MKKHFILALLGTLAFGSASHAQSSTPTNDTSDMQVMSPSMMPMSLTPASPPTATIVRRYIDSDGNLSAVDVRFSDGLGRGETRQLRIVPALVLSSEAAAPYGLGRTLAAAVTDASVLTPPSFDPDGSQDQIRGVIASADNTTGARPLFDRTVEQMLAGGFQNRR